MKLYEQYFQEIETDTARSITKAVILGSFFSFIFYLNKKEEKCFDSCQKSWYKGNKKEKNISLCRKNCKKLKGKEKIQLLKSRRNQCNKTEDPIDCKNTIDSHIKHELEKLKKL